MRKSWIIPRLWRGPVHVVGGGPSLHDFPFEALRGKRIIAINSAFEDLPFAQFCYFMDYTWWKWNKDKIRTFSGVTVTTCSLVEDTFVKFVKPAPDDSLGNGQASCMRGRCSGQGAIAFAEKLGGTEIFLHGFDMKTDEGGKHNYHNRHKRSAKEGNYVNRFLPQFPRLKTLLDAKGVKVYNATENSELKVFEFVSREQALAY